PLRRRALWLAVLFGALVALRQALPGENTSPLFAYLAWAAWMWWLPAFLESARGEGREIGTGVVLGVALQVAGQIALHGLDLELVNGPASVVAAVLLVLAFVLALRVRGDAVVGEGGAWGALALGPFL